MIIIVRMKLILASTSPNRKELFDRMGVTYEALAPDYEEIIDPKLEPFAQVEAFALGKAESVLQKIEFELSKLSNEKSSNSDFLVMGFDSMIEFEGGSLGKAHSKEEAQTMLKSFVGKSQQIVSGFALLGQYQGKKFQILDHQATKAQFRTDVTDAEIKHYLTFGDWAGKCGAYSILGPGIFFLDHIEGDFQNIIGVPVMKIGQLIKKELGISWLELLAVAKN